MGTILERVEHLIALASSPNENEARNAAYLAVQLLRKHRIVLTMPPTSARKPTPPPRRRLTPRGARRIVDVPEKIVAPLGGECIQCGSRYRVSQTILWLSASGGLHIKCFDDWAKKAR